MNRILLRCFFLIFYLQYSLTATIAASADINGDCQVDIYDLTIIAENWLQENQEVNLDNQAIINYIDFSILALNWMRPNCAIRISEIMASNHSTLADDDGDYPDWIELYNVSQHDINLKSFYLTDDQMNLKKWKFPDTPIQAGELLLIFASGKNKTVSGNPLHTNFELERDGEYLALVAPDGKLIVDEFTAAYPIQTRDISWGTAMPVKTLISPQSPAKYLVPPDDTHQTQWMLQSFNDLSWTDTEAELGFGSIAGTDIVAYWNLDEVTGTIANDLSNYDNHGTLRNGLNFSDDSISAISGAGLSFDGTDDYVEIADSDALTPEHFSISLWVLPTDLGGGSQNTIAKRDTSNNGSYVFECNGTSVNHYININGWELFRMTYVEDQWQHVVVTYDGSKIRGYINAQFKNDVSVSGVLNNDPGPLYLGNTAYSSRPFYGSLDEVSIYNRALTQSEISQIYSNPGGQLSTNPIQNEMLGKNASLWLRSEFDVENVDDIDTLMLSIKYEDGFAAYLNGQLVANRNAPSELLWNSSALTDYEIPSEWLPEKISIPDPQTILHNGTNVLAIHALNDDKNDSNFALVPELIAVKNQESLEYFDIPTPGWQNGTGFEGIVLDTRFDVNRGIYSDPFDLTISTDTPDAQIYYTTDSSDPSPENNAALLYDSPIDINQTTIIRAAAFKNDYIPSNVDTQSYIFPSDVPQQNNMWTDVTQDTEWGPKMVDSLTAIPTVSLVTPNNISQVETETSIEMMFPDGTEGFHAYAGVEHYGGHSLGYPKKSMRISFKRQYGPARLHYDLFGGQATDEFDQFLLRTGSHDSVFYYNNSVGCYLRNRWTSDIQLAMGQPAPHGRFVHVYINGVYWGQHQLMERPNAAFMASYFGGDKEGYDALNKGIAIDGNTDSWDTMVDSTDNYETLNQYMDVVNYADYLLLEFYSGNDWDWNHKQNWMAARKRQENTGFKFFAWDNDMKLRRSPDANVINRGGPSNMWPDISQHTEFKMLLADRAHKYFFNNGLLTDLRVQQDFDRLSELVRLSVIAECARWGSNKSYDPNTWQDAVDWITSEYVPGRTGTVLQQLRDEGMYPQTEAPVFNINGTYQHGGIISTGDILTMTNPNFAGTIYFTIDGSDPRLPGGNVNPDATILGSSSQHQNILVDMGAAQWSYLYDGTDQGTLWRSSAFDDSSWNSGTGQFGFGNGDESTDIGPRVNHRYTAYFRNTFNASNVEENTGLSINLIYDDGAVVYINGQEVRRIHMPEGNVYYNTPSDGSGGDNAVISWSDIDPSILIEGENVIAVEVHQVSATSADLSFDLRLTVSTPADSTEQQPLLNSTLVKARIKSDSTWSALNEAVYAAGPVTESLRISELMYHPAADPNSEFIELTNVGDESINLNLVEFANGIDFVFPSIGLEPGDYVVVVKNLDAFNTAYPDFDGVIAGVFDGSLDNDGDRLLLQDAIGTVIHDFKFKDGWFKITDGGGFTLTVIDPANTDTLLYGEKDAWRASTNKLGSPGTDDIGPAPGDIVVNEVLAHSDVWPNDQIEIYNASEYEISIGGWYLSDNNDSDLNLMKYRIPDGTTITSDGYVLITQDEHFGNDFALSENGDKVCLSSAVGNQLTGYREIESFGASEVGVTLGRYYKASTDTFNFVAMSEPTFGYANSSPKVGPIVISEIMYHPPVGGSYDKDEYEYIELYNLSSSPIALYDSELSEGWAFTDGVDFTFAPGDVIAAHSRIVIAKNLAAFQQRYGFAADFSPFENDTSLKNSGERLQLSKPGDIDEDGVRQYIRVDRVNYSDGSHPEDADPWPTEPDGLGMSLTRKVLTNYGNDHINWTFNNPSPKQ